MSDYRPPSAASPILTGGRGFTYADRVAARVLLSMLANEPLLGVPAGIPLEVRFEQRPANQLFDDLVVAALPDKRWAVTVKSGEVINAGQLDSDLIDRAWWSLESNESAAGPEDLLVIAQPPLSEEAMGSMTKLIRWSSEQAEGQVGQWIGTANVSSQSDRTIWEKLKRGSPERDPQNLLRRLRFLPLGLDPLLGQDLGGVRNVAEILLAEPARWELLWNCLLAIASEARGDAAFFDVPKLVSRIPETLVLLNQGDVGVDLEALRSWGAAQAPINRKIGSQVSLDNSAILARLSQVAGRNRFILLVGQSGIGKSVTLAEWCEGRQAFFLRADSLRDPADSAHSAGSRRNIPDLLRLSREHHLDFVVDQIDRVESDSSWAILTAWLHVLAQDVRVRIIFGCTSTVAGQRLVELSTVLGESPEVVPFERPFADVLNQLKLELPTVATLVESYNPSPAIATPRVLDQLVNMGLAEWPSTFSEFLDLFWRFRIQGPTGDATIRDAARQLAEHEASAGTGRLPDSINHVALERLRSRSVVVDDGEGLSWDHDSTGDNIRAKILLDLDGDNGVGPRLAMCVLNPVWRRAFRLFCIAVVENEDVAGFVRLLDLVKAEEDNLLELSVFDAIILCPPSMALPSRVGSVLASDDRLMGRYLTRFLYSGADPLSGLTAGVNQEALSVRAQLRLPKWDRWLPTAQMVLDQRRWFRGPNARLGLEVLVPYLEALADSDFLKASRRALVLAHSSMRSQRRFRRDDTKSKNLVFRAAISTLPFEHHSGTNLLRRAAGRIGPKILPLTTRYEPISVRLRTANEIIPWQLGPRSRVDSDFQEFYLGGDWPARIAKTDLSLAKELFFACVIEEPQLTERDWSEREAAFGLSHEMRLPFFPATHQNPSINSFFKVSFEAGLDVVVTLIGFSVERYLADLGATTPVGLSIVWGSGVRFFAGDARVYHWMDGSSVAPYVLQSLLRTLEHHLLRIEDYDELRKCVQTVLGRTHNLAMLAVLVSVAKASPSLLLSDLAPLLFSEDIDCLDIRSSVATSAYSMASVRNEWWRNQDEAVRFAGLPHRRNHLRQFSTFYLVHGDRSLAEQGRQRWLQLAGLADDGQAHILRILAALYDHTQLTTETDAQGLNLTTVVMPVELTRRSEAEQARSEEHIRLLGLPYRIQGALERNNDLSALGNMLLEDVRLASDQPETLGDPTSLLIGALVVCLRAAQVSSPTMAGATEECRKRLITELTTIPDHARKQPEFDDPHHWTQLVALEAATVFLPSPRTVEERRALVTFVESARGFTLHHFIRVILPEPEGVGTALLTLSIARVWAVESVRLQQASHFARFSVSDIPSAMDLAYSERISAYIESGAWKPDDRRGLGRSDPRSEVQWRPAAFEIVLAPLLEFLANCRDTPALEAGYAILDDALEAVVWRTQGDEDHYDRSAHEAWTLVGDYLSLLPAEARQRIVPLWAADLVANPDRAEELMDGLLTFFSARPTEIEQASAAFVEVFAAGVQAMTMVDKPLARFYMRCFGIQNHGLSVRWDVAAGQRWVTKHLAQYKVMIPAIVEQGYAGRLLKHLTRPEFEPLDEALFAELSGHLDKVTLRNDTPPNLAALLIRFAPLAKGNSTIRDQWRRMLAYLEASGERLAWQVLAEIADRV